MGATGEVSAHSAYSDSSALYLSYISFDHFLDPPESPSSAALPMSVYFVLVVLRNSLPSVIISYASLSKKVDLKLIAYGAVARRVECIWDGTGVNFLQ